MSKARITNIKFGNIELEGLSWLDSSSKVQYGVAVTQLAVPLSFDKNQGSRAIKTLMGGTFPFDKIKSEVNSKAVNVVTVGQLFQVLRAFDKAGNEGASNLLDALGELSLHQLFADSFGDKFDADDRQAWLKARLAGKKTRRTLTDKIQDLGGNPESIVYAKATIDVYRLAQQLPADQQWSKQEPKLKRQQPFRDTLDDDQLREVEYVETALSRYFVSNGGDWQKAVDNYKLMNF